MRIRNLRVSNSRLTEGEWFDFVILKALALSDTESFYVLQDPLGYKVMIPARFYTHYGFQTGQQIRCRVDKINCNGQMFLEPEHPVYREGREYDFEVVETGLQSSLLHDKACYYRVKDVHGKTWNVMVFSEPESMEQHKVKCRVVRIKKGMLFLNLAGETPLQTHLKIGQEYLFEILEEKKNPSDKHMYYLLKDRLGHRHLLMKKYYPHYNLKPGQQIWCKVDKFSSEGSYLLEPRNPYYETGKVYNFAVLRLDKLIFSDESVQDVLILKDYFGDEVKVFVEPATLEYLQNITEVKALVSRIRKSRLELVLI